MPPTLDLGEPSGPICEVDRKPCNRSGGVQRHRYRGEKACQPCLDANNAVKKEWKAAWDPDGEKQKAIEKAWVKQNPEKVRAKARRYEERNPGARAAARKRWRERHPEKAKAANDRWRKANPDKIASYNPRRTAYAREWRAKNPDKAAEYSRRWRERHPEKAAARNKVKRDPEQTRRYNRDARRRGRLKKPRRYGPDLAVRDGGWCCAYCDALLLGSEWTVDHIHPLAAVDTYAGEDINELANLVLACPPCNSSKCDRLLWIEWVPPNGRGPRHLPPPEGR